MMQIAHTQQSKSYHHYGIVWVFSIPKQQSILTGWEYNVSPFLPLVGQTFHLQLQSGAGGSSNIAQYLAMILIPL